MNGGDRFRRVDSLFRGALRLEAREREAYLDDQCGPDHLLRAEVAALLEEDQTARGALDQPALGAGFDLRALASEPAEPQRLPERIGKYQIVSLLGVGGMGAVYEAEQDEPRRRVALKVIRAGVASRNLLRRFRHEAQMLGQLMHPGIAQIYEAGTADDGEGAMPFFAMELVVGEPLLEYAQRTDLSVRDRLELVARIADAVSHAHSRGVIHRDLKPANILVDRAGQPKILDFGVARATDADIQAVTLHTDIGQLVGTVAYMSPEQAMGDSSALDIRSDVYALGVVMYELLAGQLPYSVQGRMIHDAVRVICEQEPARLSSISRAFRGDVETIVAKALEKDPQRRYQSAAELSGDIGRYLRDQTITARPASTLHQFRKFARRNRALVSGLAVGLILMLGGTALAIWQAITATHARAVAVKQSETADLRTAEALRQAYRATIAAAAAALDARDPITARQRLMEIREPERNWEWRYLYAKLDQSAASFEAGGPVVGAGLSADGQHVVLVTRDGRVVLTNRASGEVARALQLDVQSIALAEVSDDGRHIALFLDSAKGSVGVADVDGAGTVRALGEAGRGVQAMAIAPDGSRIATLRAGTLALWDCSDGAGMRSVPAGCYSASIRFSRDSSQVAIGCIEVARVLDAATGAVVREHTLANAGPGAALTGDGSLFITGGADKKVHVVDMRSGQTLETYGGHLGQVREVALSPDQTRIASTAADGTLRIWQRGVEAPLAVFNMPNNASRSLRFLPDGETLLTHDTQAVKLWRVDAAPPDILSEHGSYVYGVAFTPDGSRLVSGSWDRTLRVWDTATRQRLSVLDTGPISDPFVTSVAISPDGNTVAAGYHRGGGRPSHIRVWNLATGALDATLASQIGEVRSLAFNPDGSLLASARTHAPLTLWNMRNPTAPPQLLSNIGVVVSVAWSRDGRLMATAHADRSVRIWDFATQQMIHELKGHSAPVRSCQFSPDGHLLATAANDVRLWDVASGQCKAVLDRHWDEVMAVAFSPDGTRLASGSRDTTIRIWDAVFGEEILQLRGHGDYVYALAFSPDGSMLASASGDATVRIWDSIPIRARRALSPPQVRGVP